MININKKFIIKTLFTMVFILQFILFTACKIHKSLNFNTSIVSKIEIADIRTINKSDKHFSKVIQFTENQKNDWEKPGIGTFPTPRYTIIFYDNTKFLYSLFIGTNWIGASYYDKQYIKSTENSVINDFLKKIELTPVKYP